MVRVALGLDLLWYELHIIRFTNGFHSMVADDTFFFLHFVYLGNKPASIILRHAEICEDFFAITYEF